MMINGQSHELPTYQPNLQSYIRDTQCLKDLSILIVGVGGIGCELLKVLCKMSLKSIHIIDMDTIELSNLNRQFLFKTEHKGQSKSLVAKETIKRINPFLNVEAHHINIKELPIQFFKQFNFLVMALDNIQARNYVNKIGVRLGIPVLDAGTLAYKGNVKMIIPQKTMCYSCEPKKSSQKLFPVCTIRMRPQKPIHCIVWAKMLFEVFFSGQEVNNDMQDLSALAKQGEETNIILQLLNKEIDGIKDAKTDSDSILSKDYIKRIKSIPQQQILSTPAHPNLQDFDSFDSKTLSSIDHIGIAKKSYIELMKQFRREKSIIFEKDDDNIIHFISSMANLRMKCFNIDQQSFNDVKNMAGNIVPAIASTNSIVSGLEVIEMFKMFFQESEKLKSYYVQNQGHKIRPLRIEKPLPDCQVCSQRAIPVTIWANFQNTQFEEIVTILNTSLSNLIQAYSINLGVKELYNSEEPNKIILSKNILHLTSGAFELDLNIMDEGNSENICTLWVVHIDQNVFRVANMERIHQNLKKNTVSREEKRRRHEEMMKAQEQHDEESSEIVCLEDEGNGQSDGLVIVEVKKNDGKDVDEGEYVEVVDQVEKRANT